MGPATSVVDGRTEVLVRTKPENGAWCLVPCRTSEKRSWSLGAGLQELIWFRPLQKSIPPASSGGQTGALFLGGASYIAPHPSVVSWACSKAATPGPSSSMITILFNRRASKAPCNISVCLFSFTLYCFIYREQGHASPVARVT